VPGPSLGYNAASDRAENRKGDLSCPGSIVEGAGTFDVEEGKRLVLAIEEDAGVDILHDVGL
jgi:hypothetical protein